MATFLERYQAGDRVAVWDELVALGEGVRHKLYYADAAVVATETMRRARHNVELLIQRLAEAGYRFVSPEDDAGLNPVPAASVFGQAPQGSGGPLAEAMREAMERAQQRLRERMTPEGRERMAAQRAMIDEHKAALAAKVAASLKKPPLRNPDVFDPPTAKTAALLKKIEKAAGGPMPISLRAWYEQVGGVSLNGSHPVINPRESKEPSYAADPLMIAPLRDLVEVLDEDMEDEDGEDRKIGLWIAPDDLHKANTSGGDPYTITIPNACADAKFEYEWHETTFVNYLRIAFQWGGFPGWQREKKWPWEALAKLTEGLLPI
jgi:hypothetical protein